MFDGKNNFLMITVDKEGPIIGYGKETLLCRLALDEGWFLPFANEAVPKNLPNSFIVRDRFPATHFGDELLERRLNVRKN